MSLHDSSGIDEQKPKDKLLGDYVFIKKRDNLEKVKIENILSLEADGNYCIISCAEGKYIIKMSLKKVHSFIGHPSFCQISKSQVLNMEKVSSFNLPKNLIFIEDQSFSLGKRYKSDILNQLKILG